MQFSRVAAVIILFVSVSLAQDPLKVCPQAYKLQFENEWVKVVRVHYAPNEKLPAHEHTQTASAYVYLNDSGPVLFKHVGKEKFAITRPATKTGSFRLYRAVQEIHEVENKSELPSDFLRVEFKTEPVDEQTMRGRFFREDYPAGENFQKVQFENEQIRVTRLVCAVGKKLDVSSPALLVALSPAKFKVSRGKARLKLVAGQTRWIDLNQQEQFENAGDAPVEMLRFDFKTKPMSRETLEKNRKHEHPKL
ncbi:MAG: hypothetical protein WBV94_32675 [Blastocatellia bacterium]